MAMQISFVEIEREGIFHVVNNNIKLSIILLCETVCESVYT